MSFIRQDLAELTKQLQGIEPSPKHKEFMDRLLKCAEARGLQVAKVGTAFRGKLPDYCIVDDDLQPVRELEAYLDSQPIRRTEPALVQYIEPYDFNPTESTNMLPITSSSRGLLRSLTASLGLVAYTEASSYGKPMQVEQPPQLIASTPSKPRRRNHTNGGTHKQNLRASKRNGKSYKVRKQA